MKKIENVGDRFIDDLIDNIINTSDSDILNETKEDYGDSLYEVKKFQEYLEESKINVGRKKLELAKEELKNKKTQYINLGVKMKDKILDLNNNKIENLEKLTSLKELDLHNNKIEKIENLEKLTSLKELDLSYNKIEKIENLGNLINLKYLFLFNNKIEKIENLENLINLKTLYLFNNPFKSISQKTYDFLKKNRYEIDDIYTIDDYIKKYNIKIEE